MNKNIIVTGATGMIGRPLSQALLERGYSLTVFTRDPERARATVPGASEYVQWAAELEGAWASHLDGAHGVINLAGENLFAGQLTFEQLGAGGENRVIATRGLVGAIERASTKPKVMVNASSTGIYGFTEVSEQIIDESFAPPRADLWSVDSERWEIEAYRTESFGVRVPAIRIGVALGREGGALPSQIAQFKSGWGGYNAPGNQGQAWIHLADIVGLFILALEREDVHGPINATAPEIVSNLEYAEVLARTLEVKASNMISEETLKGYVGLAADVTTFMRRVQPQRALELGYAFQFPKLEPALRDLIGGVKP